MRFRSRLLTAAVAILATVSAVAGGLPPNFLRADEIQRGMKGYGLTVLQGTKIERFEVEVLGVLKNAMPKQNIVVCSMRGAGLEKTGIIAGMSGSPVYLKVGNDYKLAGAVAYGWTFPKDPVCGITPIENMHGVITASSEAEKAAAAGGAALDAPITIGSRQFSEIKLASAPPTFDKLIGQSAALYRLQTPLYVGGVSPAVFKLLSKELEPFGFLPVQGGGAASATAHKGLKLEPGSAMAIRMAEGDLEMDGIGTCTAVIGDQVLGFGHPMMGEGRVSVPMATAVVHLSFPSVMRSFKLASSVKTVGRLTADMQAAVLGKVGDFATMIPVEVKLRRADMKGEDTYRMRVFEHPRLTSRVIGMFLANSLMIKGTFPQENTLTYRATVRLKGHQPLELTNVYSGLSSSAGLMKAIGDIYAPIGLLMANPFGKVRVEGVAAEFEVLPRNSDAGIESVRLESNEVKPGETIRALVSLRTYKKDTVVQAVELKLPDDFPPGGTTVTVCDARTSGSSDRSDAPHIYVPRTVASLVDTLRIQAPGRRLYIRMRLPDRGVAYKGKELPSLPASVLGVIQSPKLTGLTATHKSITAFVDTPYVIQGTHTLPLLVRPKEAP